MNINFSQFIYIYSVYFLGLMKNDYSVVSRRVVRLFRADDVNVTSLAPFVASLKKSDYYFTQNVSDRRESFISRQARFISST